MYKKLVLVFEKPMLGWEAGLMIIFFHHPGQFFRNGMDPVIKRRMDSYTNIIKLNISYIDIVYFA